MGSRVIKEVIMIKIIVEYNDSDLNRVFTTVIDREAITWIRLVSVFIDMLNGMGYYIDKSTIDITTEYEKINLDLYEEDNYG